MNKKNCQRLKFVERYLPTEVWNFENETYDIIEPTLFECHYFNGLALFHETVRNKQVTIISTLLSDRNL